MPRARRAAYRALQASNKRVSRNMTRQARYMYTAKPLKVRAFRRTMNNMNRNARAQTRLLRVGKRH